MEIETFNVSFIATNATKVVYGSLFGGMHPVYIDLFKKKVYIFVILFTKIFYKHPTKFTSHVWIIRHGGGNRVFFLLHDGKYKAR